MRAVENGILTGVERVEGGCEKLNRRTGVTGGYDRGRNGAEYARGDCRAALAMTGKEALWCRRYRVAVKLACCVIARSEVTKQSFPVSNSFLSFPQSTFPVFSATLFNHLASLAFLCCSV